MEVLSTHQECVVLKKALKVIQISGAMIRADNATCSCRHVEFIKSLENAKEGLLAVAQKKPAARRDLVGAQRNDLLLAPFAEGNIIAKSWAQPDSNAVVEIFDNMIDNVALKNADPQKAIENAEKSVNLLIKK